MKKTIIASSIALSIAAASNIVAAEDIYFDQDKPATIDTLNEGAGFGAGGLVGGLLAGPVGLVIGSIGGKIIGEQLDKADQYDVAMDDVQQLKTQLASSELALAALEQQLALANSQNQQLQSLAMTGLEFQVMFQTGNDTLSEATVQRLDELADFLHRNPGLNIRLHGHADPRGTDEYNNVLSMHRAINVQKQLESRGIDASRIERYSYGADQSIAAKGDFDSYALERRVSIQVFDPSGEVAVIK